MLLSIIIINYNTFRLTCDCIQSIKKTVHVDYEILLVDNNSKEKDPEEFLKLFPFIRLITLKENVGFGRANNIGMEASAGDYFLLLNSDTIVLENTINETVFYINNHTYVDVLGCRVQYPDGNKQLTVFAYGGELKLLSAIKFFFKKNAIIKQCERVLTYIIKKIKGQKQLLNQAIQDEPVPNYNNGERIGSLMGVFLLIRRSVFLSTKGFDPDFFMYYEETEWFLKRLRCHNIVYYPKVSVIHYYGKSDVYNKMNLQYNISGYLFWYKISYLHYFFFLLFNVIDIPCKLVMGIIMFQRKYFAEVLISLSALPYAVFDIPRFRNAFGSRKEMLKLNYLKKMNQ